MVPGFRFGISRVSILNMMVRVGTNIAPATNDEYVTFNDD
jgi:hypothetical protein